MYHLFSLFYTAYVIARFRGNIDLVVPTPSCLPERMYLLHYSCRLFLYPGMKMEEEACYLSG